MRIPVNETFFLTEIRPADKRAFVEHLDDREIYERTLRIPFPYTATDADKFLEIARSASEQYGQPVHFAIRGADDFLIGGCGFDGLVPGHRAELGYWLARPFRDRGIMTATVAAARDYAVDQWKLVRITAHVFCFNTASARVLEKNGFVCEGVQRKASLKDGQFVDEATYAYVR
ncbi:MAG TPA: GNAT family N-acetyltransferase [Pirellulales bacterium]|jgi:RimJ/RimL family protein N-acetyltransferase|nr:GNAT family N-acetyltransferase [Pirellulales bacterium]